jgi:hypothetical protein
MLIISSHIEENYIDERGRERERERERNLTRSDEISE